MRVDFSQADGTVVLPAQQRRRWHRDSLWLQRRFERRIRKATLEMRKTVLTFTASAPL